MMRLADSEIPMEHKVQLTACLSTEVVNGNYLGPEKGETGLPKKAKVAGYGNQAENLRAYSEE
jgi:hypothetical protein